MVGNEGDPGGAGPGPGSEGRIPRNKVVGVLFPGYVRDKERVIEALGGSAAISALVAGKTDMLALRFRPEDPFCHPAFSVRVKHPGLLLQLGEGDGFQNSRVAAVVESVHSFPNMADFQYRPPANVGTLRNGYGHLLDWSPVDAGEDAAENLLSSDEPLCMIPPLFSRIDNPSNIFEKESWGLGVRASRSRKGRKSDAAPQEDRGANEREGQEEGVSQPWGALLQAVRRVAPDVPQVPAYGEEGGAKPQGTDADADRASDRLRSLAMRCAVWTPADLLSELAPANLPGEAIEKAVRRWCYSFLSGPFADTLVRRGFDPRRDPSAALLQPVACRVRQPWATMEPAATVPEGALWALAALPSGTSALVPMGRVMQVAAPGTREAQLEFQDVYSPQTGWWSGAALATAREAVEREWDRLVQSMVAAWEGDRGSDNSSAANSLDAMRGQDTLAGSLASIAAAFAHGASTRAAQ